MDFWWCILGSTIRDTEGGGGGKIEHYLEQLKAIDVGPVLFTVQQLHFFCDKLPRYITLRAGSSWEDLNTVTLVSPDPPSSEVTVSPNVK